VFRLATSGPRIQVNLGPSVPQSKQVQIDDDSTSGDPTAIDVKK
jgi:hypothetical protein